MTNFIFPLATLAYAGRSPWFLTNFSVLGGGEGRPVFLLWGATAGLYFCRFTGQLLKISASCSQTAFGRRAGRPLPEAALLSLSAIFFAAALFLPYRPERSLPLSGLHTACAFLASAGLSAAVLLSAGRLCRLWPQLFLPFFPMAAAAACVAAVLFLAAGMVSTALEVYFSLSMAFLLSWLLHRARAAAGLSEGSP